MTPSSDRWGVEYGRFFYPLLERLAAVPGVTSVGGVSSLPMTGVVGMAGSTLGPVQIDEHPVPEGDLRPNFLTKEASPRYFETMGIPILEGRGFTRDDYSPDYSRTAFIISRSLKRRYWPDESALGKSLTWGRLRGAIVGVAGDVHHRGLDRPVEEIVYSAQIRRELMIAVRTAGEPTSIVRHLRGVVNDIDPTVPVTRVRTMRNIVDESLNRMSFTMTLLLLAAGIGLFLASVGIYGVLSYVASQRSAEVGVRLAVGADPQAIRNLILSRGMSLAGLGVAFGLAGSIAVSGVLNSLLFEVSPMDFPTLAGASSILLCVAAISSLIPAMRAAKTSPMVPLGTEG